MAEVVVAAVTEASYSSAADSEEPVISADSGLGSEKEKNSVEETVNQLVTVVAADGIDWDSIPDLDP